MSGFARLALVTLALGLVGGAGGCVLDLAHRVSCGDGYVDGEAGEECDPADIQSFIGACGRPGSRAACDPQTCELIVDAIQCAVCGDGLVERSAGEECDGNNNSARCWGEGTPSCTEDCKVDFSTCDRCGNGVLDDPEEECDPEPPDPTAPDRGPETVASRQCAGSVTGAPEDVPPLATPYPLDENGDPTPYSSYASGTVRECRSDCTYDRRGCSYCGNGRVDPPLQVSSDPLFLSLEEFCDGDLFDFDRLDEAFRDLNCSGATRPNAACAEDCRDFVLRDRQTPCCIKKGEACPEDDDAVRCCHEYSHPELADHCDVVMVPSDGGTSSGGPVNRCL